MVLPTTLKKRHSLKGIKLLPVIKRIRAGKPETLKDFACINKDSRTENLKMDEIARYIAEITGEEIPELLHLAGRNETLEDAQWALHAIIIYANEVGQPKCQDLTEELVPGTSSSVVQEDIAASSSAKRKREPESVNLEDRIASLEKAAKVEMIQELKQKVVKHEEADMFEELARQANRYQAKLDISNLCLSVLGGKAADAIGKAIAKCMKDTKTDSKNEVKSVSSESQSKTEASPLSNLYPSHNMPFMYSMAPMASGTQPSWQSYGTPGYFNQGYRNRRFGFRPNGIGRGACLFCDSTSHQVKDCQKMKAAKGK